MSKLQELALSKHAYYCSENNYFSRETSCDFESWEDFIAEFGDADDDYNLLFRWDIHKTELSEGEVDEQQLGDYYAEFFYILQRKGIFLPCKVRNIKEEDADAIIEFLKPKFKYLTDLWQPLNKDSSHA